jgi:glycosylphosphatidylinositol deacylase
VQVKGVPVLFIPGNAGSYKQVRSLASEAAYHHHNFYRYGAGANSPGKRPLDFFSVDFNEDFTAFHGQTLLDQAEYLNDAIAYILSLYHSPSRSLRDSDLPDPTSVIIVGHSMGGMVARTLLTMPNYQSNSINTIITLSAPHAMAPISFDGDIVRTYKGVNDYWRHAYAQKWAMDNPLWHVTLISIAGGGLDTIVSSDYASLASVVPETHGFTVFTASIPNCWTGTDHLSITWCDQVRKSIVRALYDVIDVARPTQTVTRAERMRRFKKWFLTGLEPIAEKMLHHTEPKTLLTLEQDSAILAHGERLTLRSLGQAEHKPKAYLLPVPTQGSTGSREFTLLTNEKLDSVGETGKLEVLLCSVFPLQAGQSEALFQMNMDLSGDSSGSTRLACQNAAADVIALPASTQHSSFPFKTDHRPFSYLQYNLDDLSEHQFVAVVDKASGHESGWVIAGFGDTSESVYRVDAGLQQILTAGVGLQIPAGHPLVVNINMPALHSSLLAYNLHVGERSCGMAELFTPLVRQYITDVHESKFFVNIKDANVNLHGIAPFMPPAFFAQQPSTGLSLQLWADPTCNSSVEVSLKVDALGSMGKLWMRYRIVFAAFPIFVVALVLRQQFTVYDETGIFISFAQSLNECMQTSLPVALTALTFLSMYLAGTRSESSQHQSLNASSDSIVSRFGHNDHELLLGSEDPFFWFLVPVFGLMCIAICVVVNYVALAIIHAFVMLYSLFTSSPLRNDDGKRTPAAFAVTSTRQRVITITILLSLVSTVIPYHFAYIVLCLVQIATCVRGCRLAKDSVRSIDPLSVYQSIDRQQRMDVDYSFYNYTHSIFILMLWILPINLPVLVVWVRNLMLHWLTPFSSHHNVLAVLPFILLVETVSTGRMIPRVQSRFCAFTNLFLFSFAAYAAVYGVTYAYVLHHLANILCAWLVAIHFDVSSFTANWIQSTFETTTYSGKNTKKRP